MLVRPIYLHPDLEGEMDRLEYSASDRELVRKFAHQGYLSIDLDTPAFDRFAEELISELKPIFSEIPRGAKHKQHPSYKGLFTAEGRIQDAAKHFKKPLELASDKEILRILKILCGREAFPFQTLNFDRGTQQRTHSDTIHFDSYPPGFMVGVWVAFEDIDANNGPLHYYEGSHRLPQLTPADFGVVGSKNGYDSYASHYEPGVQEFIEASGLRKQQAHMKRGQAFIWAANLFHGGEPIRESGRSRHSQVTHYYFDDCCYTAPILSDPIIGKISRQYPLDLRTGSPKPNLYLGQAVQPTLKERLRKLASIVRQ